MKAVILDGYSVNPGDLSWKSLENIVDLEIYDRTSPEEIRARVSDADIILTNKVVLEKDLLDSLPRLKYIGVLATGYNVVDIRSAEAAGIEVTNIPAYSTESVAQMVFSHILAITSRVEHYTSENRKGRWTASPDFVYWDKPFQELCGKTLGIVGYGNIGKAVSRIALAFGMNVLAYTSKNPEDLPEGVTKTDMDGLFSSSDIISLHCPLAENTFHLVNSDRLALMKKTAVLINTGRGPLVDETALASALENGDICAAGLDVLSQEPPVADNPLLSARNCFITPHLGWATVEARKRLIDIAVDNIKSFMTGNTKNLVTQKNKQ